MVRFITTRAKDGTRPVDVPVIPCSCEHAFQDRRLGKGQRYATTGQKETKIIYRCTVCGKEY